MKQYIKANRAQLLAAMQASSISHKIDKMQLHDQHRYILLKAAKEASRDDRYKHPKIMIGCRIYMTKKPGLCGHQFIADVWVRVEDQHYQASGKNLTGGYGYDKVSQAVENAFIALGLDSDMVENFGGTGAHITVLEQLAAKLAGGKAWFYV